MKSLDVVQMRTETPQIQFTFNFELNFWLLFTQKHFTLARIVAIPTFSYTA